MNTEILWKNFLDKIKEQVSSLSFDTWFKETKLVDINDNSATIIVPMNLHKKHLPENYSDIISNTFNLLTGTNFNFNYILESEFTPKKEKIQEKEDIVGVKTISASMANLNPNFDFESFMVGDSNKFAYTASMSVAENPGKSYNPLFIYGKSGLGKTHLMQAIGNYIIKTSNLKVLYVTSEKFVNEFINTVRKREKDNYELIDSFKDKYRNIDVLIIDDIQFLEGAIQSQQEFFHTFNELYNSNKQIIISSDRSVDDLKLLEERLRTRFSSGLIANIFPPDFELRMSIIRKKIQHHENAEDVPLEVIEYIANNFESDVRQLEGAITRVFAYSLMMSKSDINLEVAIEALKDQLNKKIMYKNDIYRIQKIVSDYFKISIDDLKSKKRSSTYNYPRQIAIYLSRIMTNESFPRIGSYFGGRDHSTIMHAFEKIDKEILKNTQLNNIIKELKNSI